MKHIKKFDQLNESVKEIPSQPFFIAAKDGSELDRKLLKEYGIKSGPGIYYIAPDGMKLEVFMHTKDGKSGWMVHPITKSVAAGAKKFDKKFNTASRRKQFMDDERDAALGEGTVNEDTQAGEVEYKGDTFRIAHIHTDKWRIVKNGVWTIVIGADVDEAKKAASKYLDLLYANTGGKVFMPKFGTNYVVTGQKFDTDSGTVKDGNTITFVTGSHNRNPGGTGKITLRKGDKLKFDEDGEDNGFWYVNGDRVKGSKGWSLLWSLQIKPVK